MRYVPMDPIWLKSKVFFLNPHQPQIHYYLAIISLASKFKQYYLSSTDIEQYYALKDIQNPYINMLTCYKINL